MGGVLPARGLSLPPVPALALAWRGAPPLPGGRLASCFPREPVTFLPARAGTALCAPLWAATLCGPRLM